jgi:hypothetical protein
LSSIASALLAALVVGALLFFIMRKRCKGTTINIELIGKILFSPSVLPIFLYLSILIL